MDEPEFDELLDGSSLGSPRVEAAREAVAPAAREALERAVARRGSIHPLAVGTPVYHRNQEWARSLSGGTARIVEVIGPDHRGDYEYVVDACRIHSQWPGPDNPMDRRAQWASYATAPAIVIDGGTVRLPPGEWSVEEVGEALAGHPLLRKPVQERGPDV